MKHASPQAGLEMRKLIPLVYETYQNIGQNEINGAGDTIGLLTGADTVTAISVQNFRGKSHPLPFLNCTSQAPIDDAHLRQSGFLSAKAKNSQTDVPAPKVFCGVLVVPPSRLHELYYRMVVEWTLEFSQIRSVSEIVSFAGLQEIGADSHVQSYNYNSKTLTESTSMVDTSSGTNIKR